MSDVKIEVHEGKTAFIVDDILIDEDDSAVEIRCTLITHKEHAEKAKKALEYAFEVWLNHEDSDERCDDLCDQVEHALGDYGVFDYILPRCEAESINHLLWVKGN